MMRSVERQDGVAFLDDVVGRQPAVLLAQVHRPAAQVQPDPDVAGGVDDGVEDRVVAPRHHVVVIERGGAAGERQLGQPDGGGGVDVLGVEATPHRVQRRSASRTGCSRRPGPG